HALVFRLPRAIPPPELLQSAPVFRVQRCELVWRSSPPILETWMRCLVRPDLPSSIGLRLSDRKGRLPSAIRERMRHPCPSCFVALSLLLCQPGRSCTRSYKPVASC